MVQIGDGIEYDALVADPAEPGVEAELAWYFEEHLRFPFLDHDRRQTAVKLVASYGQALFGQVFAGPASFDYEQLRRRSFDGCRLVVVGSAAFHRLHWEALRDPRDGEALSVRMPVTRQVSRQPSQFDLPPTRPTLNILVVTARPGGAHDVGYRTISRPLLDALRQARIPVTVDLVRPGTWPALRERLRAATEEHGSGWYQVVHFDLHGGVGDYAALAQQRLAGALSFQTAGVEPFTGTRAFLFFETGQDGQAEPVPAATLADLLAEHRVPVAVLNACQSAMDTTTEASLAQQLVQSGVPVAVGMAYSVTVSAAELAMPVLYGRLADGAQPVHATHAARRALFEQRDRQAYFDQRIQLEDWLLPVAFQQQPVRLHLADMTDAQRRAFFERQADIGGEPATEYGFVGRDLDIQAIERRLLTPQNPNLLLVRGLAGAGKSTLLRHLGWWWQRTGLVEKVFRFSFEDRAWTADQVVREIAAALLSPVELADLDSYPQPARMQRIAQLLRARRHLIILDNTESITGTAAAIPHALTPAEQDRLRQLLSELRGGRTLVLLGSREAETWLAEGTFADNVHPLSGLDPQAASVLVERILTRHQATRHRTDPTQRDALQQLVKLLDGYPLPLTVILPILRTVDPATVLSDLEQGTTGADPLGTIGRAIEYSHGKLDPAVQSALLLLAPFTATVPTGSILDHYKTLLEQHEPINALGPIDLQGAVAETMRVGLATEHAQLSSMAQMQPVLPYFLRTRLHQHPILAAAVNDAHYQLYADLAGSIANLLTARTPNERGLGHAITRASYASLTTALEHGLRTRRPIAAIVAAVEEFLDQAQQHDTRRTLLDAAIAAYPAPTTNHHHAELAQLHNLAGATALKQNRLDDAHEHYQTSLACQQAAGLLDNVGITYHQLGRVAHEQRRFDEAEQHFRRALEIDLEFNDRHGSGGTYHHLGMVAQQQERFDEAERHYHQALDIKLEFHDRRGAADTYHQLGSIAHQQRRFDEAERHFHQALDIYLEFNDRYETADVHHELGNTAAQQGRFDEAERHYRQALDIYLQFEDRHGAAVTYHSLGVIAQNKQRFEESERHYHQAVDIYLEFNDWHSMASTYHQLGRVAHEQRHFEEAERHYHQALDIRVEHNDPRGAAVSYRRLAVALIRLDRYEAAVNALVRAAVLWRPLTQNWPTDTLSGLKHLRGRLGDQAFEALLQKTVPADQVELLRQAIDGAEDISDIDDA